MNYSGKSECDIDLVLFGYTSFCENFYYVAGTPNCESIRERGGGVGGLAEEGVRR